MSTLMPNAEQPRRSLLDYAARLLIGSGVEPSQVASIASGGATHDSPAAAAMRDGWQTAERGAGK